MADSLRRLKKNVVLNEETSSFKFVNFSIIFWWASVGRCFKRLKSKFSKINAKSSKLHSNPNSNVFKVFLNLSLSDKDKAIVGIVFEDKIPWIDEKAAECIEKYGLAAFRRNGEGIEVHHCKGYATFSSRTEAMNNLKINCDLNNIRFLPANVHKVLGYIQPNMKRLYSNTETIEDIHAINEALVRADVKETTIVSPGASGRQGDIRCLGDTVTTLDGRQMSFENAIKDMLQGMILKKIN